jgi:hypothetical protein
MPCEVVGVDIMRAKSRLMGLLVAVPYLGPTLVAPLGVPFLPAFAVAWFVLPALYITWSWVYAKRDVPVFVSHDGVTVDGKLLVPRTSLVGALVEPGASGVGDPDLVRRILHGRARSRGRSSVVLRGRGWTERVMFVRSVEDGRAIVEALGFDAKATVATFDGSSALVATPARKAIALGFVTSLVFAVGWAGLSAPPSPNVLFAALGVMTLGVLAAMWPSRITVGTDAVIIRWLRWTKAIDLTTVLGVESVSPTAGTVRLALRNGGHVDVPTTLVHRVAERIEQARATRISRDNALHAALPLARGARTITDWVARLRRVERSFRDAALPADRLWSTVEDASVEPSTRVAAAVALAPTLGEGGRSRLRVAAQSSATPKLRVALTAVVDGDDDTLEDALGGLEDQRAR